MEQFAVGHIHGSSHGDGRIVRSADFQDIYFEMGAYSLKLWKELERKQNTQLLHLSGLLILGRGKNGVADVNDVEKVLSNRKFPYKMLSPEESNRRFPQFHLSPEDKCVYTEDGGMVFADKAIKSFHKEALKEGAIIKQHVGVKRIDKSSPSVVKVETTDDQIFSGKRVIMCVGAWTNEILSQSGMKRLPVQILNEQVSYFNPKSECPKEIDFSIKGNMPAFIIVGDIQAYGMPHVTNAVDGVKIASHVFAGHSESEYINNEVDPSHREYTVNQKRLKMTQDCLRSYFPRLDTSAVNIARCLYQKSPDGHFIIDNHIDDERIIVATGFSGAGFKHAPVVGLILTQLANGEKPVIEISQLSMKRFFLNGNQKSKL